MWWLDHHEILIETPELKRCLEQKFELQLEMNDFLSLQLCSKNTKQWTAYPVADADEGIH
jgi:hypothetical protein